MKDMTGPWPATSTRAALRRKTMCDAGQDPPAGDAVGVRLSTGGPVEAAGPASHRRRRYGCEQ